MVAKKQLNILKNQKEGVELKLERSAQTVKNEAFKVSRRRRRSRSKIFCGSQMRSKTRIKPSGFSPFSR